MGHGIHNVRAPRTAKGGSTGNSEDGTHSGVATKSATGNRAPTSRPTNGGGAPASRGIGDSGAKGAIEREAAL